MLDSNEDRMSVLLHTCSARLTVHVVIYINKLFSAQDQPNLLQVTRLGLFFADLTGVDCCDQSERIDWGGTMACKSHAKVIAHRQLAGKSSVVNCLLFSSLLFSDWTAP